LYPVRAARHSLPSVRRRCSLGGKLVRDLVPCQLEGIGWLKGSAGYADGAEMPLLKCPTPEAETDNSTPFRKPDRAERPIKPQQRATERAERRATQAARSSRAAEWLRLCRLSHYSFPLAFDGRDDMIAACQTFLLALVPGAGRGCSRFVVCSR
jgi:hypothetical protein